MSPSFAAAQKVNELKLSTIPTHLEFISEWFPRDANSAVYADIVDARRLATRMAGRETQFESILAPLELIKASVGFDPTRIERFTMATISTGIPGTVIFFTLNDQQPISDHFASSGSPVNHEVHHFHNLNVYKLKLSDRNIGLFSADGKHFILGDWAAFKRTLLGNNGSLNELAKLLAKHYAPIIVCSNPRKSTARPAIDCVFSTVMSFEYKDELLAFMMEEEHATPAAAIQRLEVMQDEMPEAFAKAYDLKNKVGTRFASQADGRYATFGLQASIKNSRKLLENLLGSASAFDPHSKANLLASGVVELYDTAREAKAITGPPASIEILLDQLLSGVSNPDGKQFRLPFTTAAERNRIIERLELIGGKDLRVVEHAVESVDASELTDKQVRRHARLFATLSVSAAAADSIDQKKLKTSREIVAAICGDGLRGGPGYERELYKGPELGMTDQSRVASFLVVENGQLVFRGR